jgi:hypothetical protein
MIKDYAGIKASAGFIDCHRLVQRPLGTLANQCHKKPRPISPDLGGSAAVMMGCAGHIAAYERAAARLSFAETDSEGMNMVNRGRFVLNWGEM